MSIDGADKAREAYRRRQRELRSSPVRLPVALSIAILLHVLAAPLVIGMFSGSSPNAGKKVTKVRMVPLTSDGRVARPTTRPKNEALAEKEKEQLKALEEKKPDEPPKDLKGQVVDVPPSPDDRPPEDSKYLSEHNTRTEKESVSRNQSKDYGNAMNEPTIARKSDGPSSPQLGGNPNVIEIGPDADKSDQNKDQKKQDKKQAQAPQLEFPKVAAADKLALALDPKLGTLQNREQTEAVAGNSTKLRVAPGQDGQAEQQEPGRAPRPGKAVIDLMPTIGVLSRIAGAPANDMLNEQEGDGTFLNTREFKYAGFYNRIKRGVSQRWNPVAEMQRRDPTGNIHGQITRTTTLQITLQPDGKLKDAVVTRSSGLDFLDNEAVQAFRRAEPFNNPPPQLVVDGHITFSFGFTLEFRDGAFGRPF